MQGMHSDTMVTMLREVLDTKKCTVPAAGAGSQVWRAAEGRRHCAARPVPDQSRSAMLPCCHCTLYDSPHWWSAKPEALQLILNCLCSACVQELCYAGLSRYLGKLAASKAGSQVSTDSFCIIWTSMPDNMARKPF